MTRLMERLQEALGPGFVIERELGGGGMSQTFVALERALGRRIVVKVLASGMGAHLSIERFQREIRVAARLAHPHIVPLLSVGQVDDLPYYTMPYVPGESLRTKLAREGELALSDAVRILRDVAAALSHAHAAGVVHRDIKPDNVILSGGVAVVTDFGVAKARDDAATDENGEPASTWVTSLGMALGTLAYMSPEQATGDPHVDHRADLYSFGCMAYELLTGRPPFIGRTPQQLLAAHVNETPEPVDVLRPSVPLALASLVMRCLQTRAADRPQSANDVLAALDEMTTPSSSGTLQTASYRPTRTPWRRRTIVAIPLVAAAAVTAWMLLRPAPLLTFGTTTQLVAEPELELDAAISPDGRFVAYASGVFGRMRIYVRQVDGGRRIALTTDIPGSHRYPAWSPDGSRLAFMADGAIYIVPALGGPPDRAISETGHVLLTPDWSPDGRAIAYADDRGLWARAVEGGEPHLLVAAPAAHSPSWSPDGRAIAYVDENATYIIDAGNIAPSAIAIVPAGGGDAHRVTDNKSMHASPHWGPDGRSLLFISDVSGARDVHQLRLRRDLNPDGDPVRLTTGLNAYAISLSADHAHMAYSVLRQRSNVWMAPMGAGVTPASAATQITVGAQVIESIDASRDGTWLLYDSNRNGNQDIFKLPLSGGEPVQLTRDPADDFGPAWSRDGREVAFYSLRNGTRDLFVMDADGRNVQQVTSGPSQDYFPGWSPDGRQLVFTRTAPGITRAIFTVARDAAGAWGAPVQRTFTNDRTAAAQRWSPDGRWIAWADAGGVALLDATAVDSTPPRRVGDIEGGVARSVAWGSSSREILYLVTYPATPTRPHEFRIVPVDGGTSRLLMRIDGVGWVQRVLRFASDGRRLFFPLADDEADVWMMDVSR